MRRVANSLYGLYRIEGSNPSLTAIKKMKKYFPLSLFLSKFLTNIFLEKNYFTPNSVTLLSFISGIIACLLFLQGTYILGNNRVIIFNTLFYFRLCRWVYSQKKKLKNKIWILFGFIKWLVNILFVFCVFGYRS